MLIRPSAFFRLIYVTLEPSETMNDYYVQQKTPTKRSKKSKRSKRESDNAPALHSKDFQAAKGCVDGRVGAHPRERRAGWSPVDGHAPFLGEIRRTTYRLGKLTGQPTNRPTNRAKEGKMSL